MRNKEIDNNHYNERHKNKNTLHFFIINTFLFLTFLVIINSAYPMGKILKNKKPEQGPTPTPIIKETPQPVSTPNNQKITRIGKNPKEVNENSGMVYSTVFNRMYMINDSGGGNYFYVTDMTGKLIEKVSIKGASNNDYEGLSYASCGTDKCLYVGDIGDNSEDNKSHKIYVIKELESFNKNSTVKTIITYEYEDKTTPNAESLAVHPSGDIYIATKNYSGKPTRIYKIAKGLFEGKDKVSVKAKLVGEIDFIKLSPGLSKDFTHTTDMSISPSGTKFLLLTDQSKTVWEFDYDLSSKETFTAIDIKPLIIPVDYLGQEESLFYLNEDEFVYTSEGNLAPIMKVKIINSVIVIY